MYTIVIEFPCLIKISCLNLDRGHIRQRGLTASQLIHVPGAGDFALHSIMAPSEEAPLALPHPDAQEPLVRENRPDPLAAEQTWPTDEEMAVADAERARRLVRVPAGTSDYQAAWILEEASDAEASGDEAQPNSPTEFAESVQDMDVSEVYCFDALHFGEPF